MGKTDEAKVRPRKPHTSAVSKKIFWFWLKNWKVWSCLGSTEAKFKKLWQYCTNSMEHIMYLKDNPQYPSISMTNFSHALNMNKMPADQKIFLLHSSGFCLYSARLEMLTPTDCGPHCTMRTLESRNSSGLIAPGHISKNHQRYSKERHFFFKLSTRRKIEKIQFPWVSYSKFSILAKYASVSYTQICIWYRAILLEDASDASVPLYKYGSILHTVPPYFPMYALCNGTENHQWIILAWVQGWILLVAK